MSIQEAITPVLRPKKLVVNLMRALKCSLVPLILSQPGAGKSEIVHEIAHNADLLLIDFRLAQADVTDMNGLPFFDNGVAKFMPFDFFPIKGQELPPKLDNNGKPLRDEKGEIIRYRGWLLFFDELTAAPKQIQAAAYKILLEKRVGTSELHPDVAIIAAGNRKQDRAVAYDMSTALQSRLVHFTMEVHAGDWLQWAYKAGIDSRVIAYINFSDNSSNEALNNFDPEHTDHTYACPRTWRFASDLIADRAEVTMDDDYAILSGTIGTAQAQQFIAFCEVAANIPSIGSILNDPENATVPAEISQQYAVAAMLGGKIDPTNAKQLIRYIKRLRVELQIITLRMGNVRNPAIKKVEEVRDLLIDYATMMEG